MSSTESPHPQYAAPKRKLPLTEADLARLRPIVRSAKHFLKGRPYIELIDQTLNDADVIPPEAIPQDVVTVNSSVVVTELDHQRQSVYTLVFPQDARSSDHLVSLMTPLGAALLGGGIGEVIEVAGSRLRIDQVIRGAT
jgi:regulator of nucleoside diphosphate kinase